METKKEIKKITKHEFYFETSLYEFVNIINLEEGFFEGDIDAFSFTQLEPTTYSITSKLNNDSDTIYLSSDWQYKSQVKGYFIVDLECKRKGDEIIRFFVLVDEDSIVKVGQFPSIADINSSEVREKYGKVASKEDLGNLIRAIGLHAHGIGAGSFVYLRRIFEKLILESYNENKSSINISENDFKLKRMSEKIELLKDFLPKHLNKLKPLYGILSDGVHNMSEEECLIHFNGIKLAIELILKQKIQIKKELEEENLIERQILDISSKIGKKNQ